MPTPGQWQAQWQSKQDWLGATPVLITGGTLTGELVTVPSSSITAGLNLPPGAAPTTPSNGDVWETSGGVFARVGGATYNLATPAFVSFVAAAVNFNAANTDTSIPIVLPPGFTRYRVTSIYLSGASASLSTATFGVFTAAAGGGTAIVTGGSAITVTTASENTNNNAQAATLNNATTESYTAATLFFRVGTAEGSAATATVTVMISPLS